MGGMVLRGQRYDFLSYGIMELWSYGIMEDAVMRGSGIEGFDLLAVDEMITLRVLLFDIT